MLQGLMPHAFLARLLFVLAGALGAAATPIRPEVTELNGFPAAGESHIFATLSSASTDGDGSTTSSRITYTLRNPSDFARTVLVWGTPLEKRLKFDAFKFSNDIAARYAGMLVKRRLAIDTNNTVMLGARGSLSKSLDLRDYYDFISGGIGDVRVEHPLWEVVDTRTVKKWWVTSKPETFTAPSPSVVARSYGIQASPTQTDAACEEDTGGSCRFLSCHASRGPTVCHRQSYFKYHCLCPPGYCAVDGACVKKTVPISSLNTHRCTEAERNIILAAAEDAEAMIECTQRNGDADPVGYFGPSHVAPHRVGQVLERASIRFEQRLYSVTCRLNEDICDDEGYTYACVYPSDTKHQINLASAFWDAPRNSIGGLVDTQAGTLIHEMTHFDDVGDTDDIAYGNRILPPELAIRNADTYEYFCETCGHADVERFGVDRFEDAFPLTCIVGLMFAAGASSFTLLLAARRYRRGILALSDPLISSCSTTA